MSITLIKSRRLRSRKQMAHKTNGHGQGKWHSRTTLWAYKRLTADASRRAHRSA